MTDLTREAPPGSLGLREVGSGEGDANIELCPVP